MKRNRSCSTSIPCLALALMTLVFMTTPILAAEYTPGILTDRASTNCGGGPTCTLREAILAANNTSGTHRILLDVGTYNLSLDGPNENSSLTGDLDIDINPNSSPNEPDLLILGAGTASTIITGLPEGGSQLSDRIFHIRTNSGATVIFRDLTIERGVVDADNGGAIYVAAGSNLELDNVIIRNSATTNIGNIDNVGLGGGIYNAGTLKITNGSVISNNAANVDQENQQASLGGGGLHNSAFANASILNNTIFNKNISLNQFTPASPAADFSNYSSGGAILNLGTLFIEDSIIGGTSTLEANQSDSGAGISNVGGFLTINKSTISYNSTTNSGPSDENEGRTGGGVFNQNAGENRGSLLITASTISNNTSTKIGGGIFNSGSPLTITHSTINNNQSEFLGAGLHNLSSQSVEISNSTIAYNSTLAVATANDPTRGGGIFSTSRVNINSVTIAGNEANEGAQIYIQDNSATDPRGLKPQITLTNTIIDHNPSTTITAEQNCDGAVEFIKSLDYNIETGNSCNLDVSSFNDQISTDPLLETALADNLASTTPPPTKTIAFASTSPAMDQRRTEGCSDLDQRYYKRDDGNCDLGAFEKDATEGAQDLADLKVTVTDSLDPAITERQLVYTITVTNIGPDESTGVTMEFTSTQGQSSAVGSIVGRNTPCTNTGTRIICDLENLEPFVTELISVTLIPTTDTRKASENLLATATVKSSVSGSDYFRGNNSFTEDTEIQSINDCDSGTPGCPAFPPSPGGGGGLIQSLSLFTLFGWLAFVITRRRSALA